MESSTKETPQYASIIVMGVSGTGKSTLGSALARALDFPYVEGDEIHPKSNIAKMSSGIPLTDEDREPWLALIRATAEEKTIRKKIGEGCGDGGLKRVVGVVVTCSALKKRYRDILRGKEKPRLPATSEPSPKSPSSLLPDLSTYFIFISGSRELLYQRLEKRPGHFMKASMLDSQLATLETPDGEEGVVTVSMEDETEVQMKQAIDGLRKAGLSL
ncbi:P-loop containing nucleoside triphosphate hydrolase protein [Amanita rubescens]|nr:P-loop containing nucleoside triphosphate hydrolase protein [Amanita rubescens]